MDTKNDEHQKKKGECSVLLLLAGVVTTLGGCLPAGYNIGVINAPSTIIKTFCNESVYTRYDTVLTESNLELLWSVIVSIFLIGGMTGSLSGSWLADRVGRKGAYIISAILGIIAALLFYGTKPANSVEMLILGRFLVGLAGGLTTTTVPMHLSELAPLSLRGMMGVLCPLGITVGVLLGQVLGLEQILGKEETWHYLLSFYIILIILSTLIIPVLPESPKYLYVIKNQPQTALIVLSKIRGLPVEELSEEIEDLRVSKRNEEDSGVSWSIMSVLQSKELLLPLLLTCSMQAGQQLSGINAVFYYSVSIFQSAGLSLETAQFVNMGAGGMNLLMGIVAIFLNMFCNRRVLLLFSCFSAALCLIVLGISITYIHSQTWIPYIAIIALLAYVFFYQFGLGPIPYFIGSELFEIGPRPSAMALGSMANWGANFIIGISFPSAQLKIGASVFYIFAALTFLLFFFQRRYFPETRNKDTSEIAALCKHGFASRPLSNPTSNTNVGFIGTK